MTPTTQAVGFRRAAAIVGVGHTDWIADLAAHRRGETVGDSLTYGARSFRAALADAGLERDDIDGLIVGPPLQYERTGEALGLDVRWGDTADAVSAVVKAVMAIACGFAETIALVYGNDQRSAATQYGGPQAMGGDISLNYVYHAPWGFTSQGSLYALMFQRYAEARGFTQADLGQVAVGQRHWAALNPNAVYRKPIEIEDYLAAPFVCEPLRLLDYCMINDGGVALIVTTAERARKLGRAAYIEAIGRFDLNRGATSLEPRISSFYLPGQQAAAQASYDMAGVGPADMQALYVYDSFSVHVPLALEGYGYCEVAGAAALLSDGAIRPGGRLPLNTNGGHLSETYMQGWAHQVEIVRQLRGECAARQVPRMRLAHYTSDIAGKSFSVIYGS